MQDWVKEGTNYWENEECPREYLENALKGLIHFIEDIHVDDELVRNMSDEELKNKIDFYEYVADK